MAEVDYKAVLDDLKARRARFDQAIALIEGIMGDLTATAAPAGTQNGGPWYSITMPIAPGSAGAVVIKPDTFYSLNILEASKKYLGMAGETQTTEQIGDALRRGGVHAKDESVAAILQRAIKAEDVELRRVRPGVWGLAVWYARSA